MAASGRRLPAGSETVLLLAGLTLVALALRIPSFGDSLWYDELGTNYDVNGFGQGGVLELVRTDTEVSPPLFFLITSLTKGLGGAGGLRAVSLLAGAAAVPLTYLLGERTVGRSAAAVGAALVALAPFMIFYSTEARAYELAVACCLVAALTMLAAIDSGRRVWWVAFALSTAAVAYTHYSAVFVALALYGWAFLAHPECRRPLLAAGVGAALLYLPWLGELQSDRHSLQARFIEIGHPLTLGSGISDLTHWAVGHPYTSVAEVPGTPALALVAAGVLLGAVAVLIQRAGDRGVAAWRPSSGLALIGALALAGPLGLLVQDVTGPTVFLPRNMIGSWPALALAAGALVTAGRAPWRYAATALVLGGFALGAAKMLDVQHRRPQFEAAVDFVESSGQAGAPVVDYQPLTPGPQTNFEAAFAADGTAAPDDRTVWTLGYPNIESRVENARHGVPNITVFLPTPSDEEVARGAAAEARTGRIFLVDPARAPIEELRRSPGPVANFLAALPAGYREAGSREFEGVGEHGFTVHVLQRGEPSRSGGS